MDSFGQAFLIPIVTGAITFLTTFYVTYLRNKAEIHNLKTELLNSYSIELFNNRLQFYPELYSILSNYMKILDYGKNNEDNLYEFYTKLESVDSRISLLLSRNTVNLIYYLRLYLISILITKKSNVNWDIVYLSIRYLDRSLRNELGTFQLNISGVDQSEILDHMDRMAALLEERAYPER